MFGNLERIKSSISRKRYPIEKGSLTSIERRMKEKEEEEFVRTMVPRARSFFE